jgi:acetyl-CoA carboxylase biotin carboxyl carrier protein
METHGNLEVGSAGGELSFAAEPGGEEGGADSSARSSMDLKLIYRLIRLMDRGEVSELEIDDERAGLRIRLRRGGVVPVAAPPPVVGIVHSAAMAAPAALAVPQASEPARAPADARRAGAVEFKSPMVGTFYRGPSPEAEPFVTVGARLGPETTVCIIEAMKVMNEIKAETVGEILEILVESGEPVEYGQPLFLIRPD